MLDALRDRRVNVVFRCVDDFLVLLCAEDVTLDVRDCKDTVLETFHAFCPDLVFTSELPLDQSIRFLDLVLSFGPNHVCWKYEPHAEKQFLPYDSSRSKIVKRGLATAALSSALESSRDHQMGPINSPRRQPDFSRLVILQRFYPPCAKSFCGGTKAFLKAERPAHPRKRVSVIRKSSSHIHTRACSQSQKRLPQDEGWQCFFPHLIKLWLCAQM